MRRLYQFHAPVCNRAQDGKRSIHVCIIVTPSEKLFERDARVHRKDQTRPSLRDAANAAVVWTGGVRQRFKIDSIAR